MPIAELSPPSPTFLGIGVPRAGTTWLHELLASHSDVSMPQGRKELHYFDQNFERGPDWYRGWFAPGPAVAVGEITPHYMYDAACIERVRVAGITRFIVVLREPVARALSHHRLRGLVDGSAADFEEFLAQHPEAVEWGKYATYLYPWINEFGRDSLCVLRFEHAVTDVAGTQRTLSAFLGIDQACFGTANSSAVNASLDLRYPRVFALAKRAARRARRGDARWAPRLARRLGADRILRAAAPVGPASRKTGAVSNPDAVRRLRELYAPELDELERLLDWDLSEWRDGAVTGGMPDA